MRSYIGVFLFCILYAFNAVYSQCDTTRYINSIFTVKKFEDVKYGEAPVWNIPYNNTDLKMDIYVPEEDTLSKRPLVLWFHSGGFLNGDKGVDDMRMLCDSFASRGYVAASVGYRKGFNPTSESSAERAVYRAVQDARAAVRYLKEKWEDYGIDTNYTYLGGSSAGAFMVLHVVYMNQEDAPSSILSGPGFPGLGCLDCTGNNYQHAMNITAYASFWGAVGDSLWIEPEETIPGLLVHGTADDVVSFTIGHPFGVPTLPKTHGSRCITNQLTALNIPHKTYFVDGAGHTFYGVDNGTFNAPPNAYWDTIFYKTQHHFHETMVGDRTAKPILGVESVCKGNIQTYFLEDYIHGFMTCWEVENATIISQSNDAITLQFDNLGIARIISKQYSEIEAYIGERIMAIDVLENPNVNFQYTILVNNEVKFHSLPAEESFSYYHWNFGDGASSTTKSPTHVYESPGIYDIIHSVTDENGCIGQNSRAIDLSTLAVEVIKGNELNAFPNPSSQEINLSFPAMLNGTLKVYDINGKEQLKISLSSKKEQIIDVSKWERGTYLIVIEELNLSQKVIVQ